MDMEKGVALNLRNRVFRQTRAAVVFLLTLGRNLDAAWAQPLPVALPVAHGEAAPC